MTFDRSLLHYYVRDALTSYSENLVMRSRDNPVLVGLNGHRYSIHVSYVHDSGNSRTNDDEIRIQLSGSQIQRQREHRAEGEEAAFIGFFKDGNTFVAWDPRHVFSLSANQVSIYARQSQAGLVERHRAAVHSFTSRGLGAASFAIALPAAALGFYLENIERFHLLRDEDSIRLLMRNYDAAYMANGAEPRANGGIGVLAEGRERFTYTRTAYPRNPRFVRDVMEAYGRACCVCGRQLAIVQAAHIVPHSEPDSQDVVNNGLALCIEHHRLYDDALLLPGPGNRLVFNETRAEYLRQTGQSEGLDAIEAQNNRPFRVPQREELRPLDEYLQRGLDVRLGE